MKKSTYCASWRRDLESQASTDTPLQVSSGKIAFEMETPLEGFVIMVCEAVVFFLVSTLILFVSAVFFTGASNKSLSCWAEHFSVWKYKIYFKLNYNGYGKVGKHMVISVSYLTSCSY